MRLLVFSDLHCHPWAAFARLDESGVNTRLRDTLNVLAAIRDTAAAEYVDAIVFAGDFFHAQKIDADVLALTGKELEAFGPLGIPVLSIEGNHDQASRVRELTSVSALRVPKNWKWLRSESVVVKGHVIWGAPFGHVEPPDVEADIVVMHRGIRGATISDYFQSPFEQDLDPSEASVHARRLVIAGHYHRPQYIDGGQVPILIPGAPLQHTWGDAGQDRGIWLVDLHEDGIDAKFIPLDFPRFVKVTSAEDLKDIGADFVSVEPGDPDVDIDLPDSIRERVRGISIGAPRIDMPAVSGVQRVQVGADLEKAIRDYARQFGQDRAEVLERIGLEILKEARC